MQLKGPQKNPQKQARIFSGWPEYIPLLLHLLHIDNGISFAHFEINPRANHLQGGHNGVRRETVMS